MPNVAPAITTPASGWLVKGMSAPFIRIAATGSPTPTWTTGTLPAGVTVTDQGDGTAKIAGTPTTVGVYSFSATAANGVAPAALIVFTLTVMATEPALQRTKQLGTRYRR